MGAQGHDDSEHDAEDGGTRLNKFISESGMCSRREADRMIEQRRVRVNGEVAEIGTRVRPGDEVRVDRRVVQAADKERAVYLAYYKPVGVECVTDPSVPNNIVDAVRHPRRIFPIGRLDVPSEGLIFLTSDGDIVNKILRAGNAHEKEYEVTVDRPVSAEFVQRMGSGVPILGTVTKKCRVERVSTFVFSIVLVEGMNRQIRRMCEYLGYEVRRLVRTRIMNITLDGLQRGDWRELSGHELDALLALVAGSSKTEEASRKSSRERRSLGGGDAATHGGAQGTRPGARDDEARGEGRDARSAGGGPRGGGGGPRGGGGGGGPRGGGGGGPRGGGARGDGGPRRGSRDGGGGARGGGGRGAGGPRGGRGGAPRGGRGGGPRGGRGGGGPRGGRGRG